MQVENCWYKKICHNKCSEYCIRYVSMKTLFEQSRIPEHLWLDKELNCGITDREAFQQVQAVADNAELFTSTGRNLFIFSEHCGNGKTSWAVRIMRKYFNAIWNYSGFECKGLFINVPHFLYECKRSISQRVEGFEELCNLIEKCDLIIWDDIAVGDLTSYEHQILLQYIDTRLNAGKSNIFTANGTLEDLEVKMGDRLSSRVLGCSEVAEFREEDKRRL